MDPFFFPKKPSVPEYYINPFEIHWFWTQGMALLHLSVLSVAIFAARCTSSAECSKPGLYPGFARDRDALLNAQMVVLHTKLPSPCEAGVRCKNFCLSDCAECNFFEMIKVSPISLPLLDKFRRRLRWSCAGVSKARDTWPFNNRRCGFMDSSLMAP